MKRLPSGKLRGAPKTLEMRDFDQEYRVKTRRECASRKERVKKQTVAGRLGIIVGGVGAESSPGVEDDWAFRYSTTVHGRRRRRRSKQLKLLFMTLGEKELLYRRFRMAIRVALECPPAMLLRRMVIFQWQP